VGGNGSGSGVFCGACPLDGFCLQEGSLRSIVWIKKESVLSRMGLTFFLWNMFSHGMT